LIVWPVIVNAVGFSEQETVILGALNQSPCRCQRNPHHSMRVAFIIGTREASVPLKTYKDVAGHADPHPLALAVVALRVRRK
jgi:hypothetical protein